MVIVQIATIVKVHLCIHKHIVSLMKIIMVFRQAAKLTNDPMVLHCPPVHDNLLLVRLRIDRRRQRYSQYFTLLSHIRIYKKMICKMKSHISSACPCTRLTYSNSNSMRKQRQKYAYQASGAPNILNTALGGKR